MSTSVECGVVHAHVGTRRGGGQGYTNVERTDGRFKTSSDAEWLGLILYEGGKGWMLGTVTLGGEREDFRK